MVRINFKQMKKLILLMLIPAITFILSAQSGLTGSWKYSAQGGEMNMQITAETIMINNQVFPYKAQGNVLMINEGQLYLLILICSMVINSLLSSREGQK
jgi:hypothetical protein